jgi:hypothetical protein
MKYISLGSNCSITWWLNEFNLRNEAYPFDWSNVTIVQLNKVLKNKFFNYVESLEVKFMSNKHLDKEYNSTALIINSYGLKFAHEVLTTNIDDFKKSLTTRIERFEKLKEDTFIIYMRIELKPINSTYVKQLEELIKLLNLINENYIIKIIIHKETTIKISLDKVKIYYYDSFSPDWIMSHLDWKSIFLS